MRLAAVAITLGSVLSITSAEAGRTGGGGGGGDGKGGRLGQVSEGLGKATSGGGNRGSGGGRDQERPYEGDLYTREDRGDETVVMAADGTIVRRIPARQERVAGPANVDVFIGLQKVYESDGAVTASLAVEDRWFRLAGAITQYQEHQMDGTTLSLTMPTIMLGVRVDDRRSGTRAFLEGGAAFAVTRNDPMVDSSVQGPVIGVHVEQPWGRMAGVADAHAMFFQDGVRAYAARVGVRVGYVEAAVRVLDFNVGPTLFGPEVGLRF